MGVVLVIDDEKVIRDVVRLHLTKAGYSVVCAEDGASGLCAAFADSPSIVICDLHMPDCSGMDVIRRIRAEREHLPIIAMSGFVNEEMVDAARKVGADEYLKKPFLKDALLTAVKTLSSRRHGGALP